MEKNSVSVVIPYYRARQTIVRALRSVLEQTVRPAEVLVVDDGSCDGVTEELGIFGTAVTLIQKGNGGAASARNLGIEMAQGEWIAFLDADDYWEPTKLERQLAVSEGIGLVGARWFTEVKGQPRQIAEAPSLELTGRKLKASAGAEIIHIAMNLWTCVVLVRRKLLCTHRFASALETAEDRDLWIRLAGTASVYVVPEPLATYVQSEDSLSNSDPDRDYGNLLRVVRQHHALLGKDEFREQEAAVYRNWAGCQLARGRPHSAIRPAARRLSLQPASLQAWWIIGKALTRSLF